MKKRIIILLILLISAMFIFAESYDNNEFQQKSRQYTAMAEKAFEEGQYDKSIEYSKIAEEYAQRSYNYIQLMLAKIEAQDAMNRARTRFTWASQNSAEKHYPDEFAIAKEALNAGTIAFKNQNYDVTVVCANKVLDALSIVTGNELSFAALPDKYIVRTWRGEKDCLWNIAKNPAIYNDAFKWKILFEANKDKLPDPNDPNWIEPGIILTIPSIKGEVRFGVYDHSEIYESLESAIGDESKKLRKKELDAKKTRETLNEDSSSIETTEPQDENPATIGITIDTDDEEIIIEPEELGLE